jgi:hypothetical protein
MAAFPAPPVRIRVPSISNKIAGMNALYFQGVTSAA